MKVLFVWPGLTGYMGDCWRELAKFATIDLKIVIDMADDKFGDGFKAEDVMKGLDWYKSLDGVISWSPDIIFTVGWHNKVCRDAVYIFPAARKVCCFDMPWEWRLRKFAARFVLWRYLRHFDAAFVPGASAARYARWLGFGESAIYRGLFATNTRRFCERKGGGGFLYVGRDVPEKGVDKLRAAYEAYRTHGGSWQLRVINGISPDDLGSIYAEADCFVLASRWEPWGVVLAEAAAAGLPIICTDKCGARHEVVRGNGFVVKSGDVDALADAMMRIERGAADIKPEIGRELAKPYSCEAWADRVMSICEELINQGL